MKLHDELCLENGLIKIHRVPGGWIYRFWEDNIDDVGRNNYRVNSVFIPLNREFQTKECQFRWIKGNMNVVCGEKLPCSKHGEKYYFDYIND